MRQMHDADLGDEANDRGEPLLSTVSGFAPGTVDPQRPTWGVLVRRYVGAVLAFWIYWIVLFGSLARAVGPTLSYDEARDAAQAGLIDTASDYGWGDHYIWFTISCLAVAFCCGALAGAIAKRRGATIAAVAVVPVVGIMGFGYYLFLQHAVDWESPIAWGIVQPLALVGTALCAYWGGRAGQETQKAEFPESTVFGIRTGHWTWLWLVSGIYVTALTSLWVRAQAYDTWDEGACILTAIPYLLMMLPFFALASAAAVMYQILSHDIMPEKSGFLRAGAFVGVYVAGLLVGGILDWLCISLLNAIASIWS